MPHAALVERLLCENGARTDRLLFAIADSNDTWARDHGPRDRSRGHRATLNDFHFNGWGGKFEIGAGQCDPRELHRKRAFQWRTMQPRHLVLEGGAVETDGAGTLLATRKTVMNASRNPGMNQPAIEAC